MRFIGQSHIMRQLRFILRTLYSNPGKGAGILLVGPSGYGKTTMGIGIAEYLVGKDFEFYNGGQDKFSLKKRVIFIDEIHKMQNCEILYPVFDAGNHVIILATNLNGGLPEALVNRCYEFIFDDYDDDELLLMARESSTFSATDESFMEIVEAGNRNPRMIKK